MKICPICKKSFADELNFCLEDGGLLVESQSYEAEKTLSLSEEQTQIRQQVITIQPLQNRQTAPYPKSRPLGFVILFGFGFLMIMGMVGAYFLLRPHQEPIEVIYYPTPGKIETPTATPTPKPENNVKVEILEKVTEKFGKKFLKCKVTNISDKVIELSYVGLTFYQEDVKIGDSRAELKLKVLKPNQTIPVWADLYGTDNYTSVKVIEPINAKPLTKPLEQIFPSLELSQTEMKYRITYYTVSGIVENQRDEKISTDIVGIFYDEKSEIVGFGTTSVFNLLKGEKTKFNLQNGNLFGKPKTFEVIAISSR